MTTKLDQANAKRWIETARAQGADRILVAFDDFDLDCPEYPRYMQPGELLELAERDLGLSDDESDAEEMQYELGVFNLQDCTYEVLVAPSCGHLRRVSQQIGDLLIESATR